MDLLITKNGSIRCLYGEAIELRQLGPLQIRRGSHVEPHELGHWHADLSPVGGPTIGPFASRSEALVAEARWLELNWLGAADPR